MSFRFRRSFLLLVVAIVGVVQSEGATESSSSFFTDSSTQEGYGKNEVDSELYDNTGDESKLSDILESSPDPESSDIVYQPMESSEQDDDSLESVSSTDVDGLESLESVSTEDELTGTEGATSSTIFPGADPFASNATSEDATTGTADPAFVDGEETESLISEEGTSITEGSHEETEEGGESVVWYDDYGNKIGEEDNESVNGEEQEAINEEESISEEASINEEDLINEEELISEEDLINEEELITEEEAITEGEEISEGEDIGDEVDEAEISDESDISEGDSTFADIDDNSDTIGNAIIVDPLYSSSMSSTDDTIVDSILSNDVAATPDPNSTPGQVFVNRVLETGYDGADGGVDSGAGDETATQGPTEAGATTDYDIDGPTDDSPTDEGPTSEDTGATDDYDLTGEYQGPTADGMGGPTEMDVGPSGDVNGRDDELESGAESEEESEAEIVEETQLITVIEEAEDEVPIKNLIGATKTLSSIVIVMALGGLICIAYFGRRKFLFYKKEQEYKNLLGDDYSEDELECGNNKLKY